MTESEPRLRLRPYQEAAALAMRRAMDEEANLKIGGKLTVQAPTGYGMTMITLAAISHLHRIGIVSPHPQVFRQFLETAQRLGMSNEIVPVYGRSFPDALQGLDCAVVHKCLVDALPRYEAGLQEARKLGLFVVLIA